MTIPEAAELVIQASSMAQGGDVFVLEMGNQIKIFDLAKRMIRLSGYTVKSSENPNGDIEIIITGLRPGEKLYEELLLGNNPQSTNHPSIKRATEEFLPWDKLYPLLNKLQDNMSEEKVTEVSKIVKKLVPEYEPDGVLVDYIYKEKSR